MADSDSVTGNALGMHSVDCSANPDNIYDYTNDGCKKPLSFLSWNVNGLFSKFIDSDFVTYASGFDFVCFVETFMESFDNTTFSEHQSFCKAAIKLTNQGRRSGGVVCLIRKELLPLVKCIDVTHANMLAFLIDKKLFKVEKDILFLCTYLPPEGSPHYAFFNIDNGPQ